MKKIIQYGKGALVLAAILIASCTKDMSEVRLDPSLTTSQSDGITSSTAIVEGFVIAEGDGFTERGICYSTTANPTTANSKVVYEGEETGATFKVTITGLAYATKYYAKAYAINANGTIYGKELTFTTLPVVPALTTTAISEITGSSAMSGGNVTNAGGADVKARGVCYSTTANPTVDNSKTTDGDGLGEFTSAMTGLLGNTTYYVRAYATNSAGTGYGPQVTFTSAVALPVVSTTAVSDITKTTAKSGGNVTYNGGAEVTARGLVWATSENPTISNNVLSGGSGNGEFALDLTGLTKFTKYYVRAFATNSAGTAYGNSISFTTMGDNLTWNLPGDYVEASYPGSGLANWSPDKSPQVKSLVTDPDKLEGYVYMANTTNSWKFATQNNWDGPNYGDGGGGALDASADNISSPKGYYKINADAAAKTYTAVATVWGVIGSGSPLGWDDETALTYHPASKTWRGVMHLKAEEIKFRANHNWDYNYGSSSKDEKLNAGGDNIAISHEADYAIVLDLSKPFEYTYEANRWGIIGDATAGGWDNDQDMVWDAGNGVFTITADLAAGSFKFRANDAWTLNYGGSLDALTAGGDNIAVATAGNYTITFDPWALKATVTKN